jgi:hypothetical protein
MPRTIDRKPSDDSNSREKKEKVSENKYKYFSINELLDERNFYKNMENPDMVEEIDFQLRLKLIN